VQVGDNVSEFSPVCEVQSDKANVEITSPHVGLVRKLYGAVGDMIEVGSCSACGHLMPMLAVAEHKQCQCRLEHRS
jgi:Biotin-requiring enzyme